ncbi:MAG: Wzz/FepE/Etk N-terminal domain-containing protein, partial [Thermodesulforhabdaceae bacterium]
MSKESMLTLRELVNVPFRFKAFIGWVVGISLLLAILYCLFARPIYNAEAKFIVKMGRERIAPLSVLPQTPYNVLLQETSQIVHDELEVLKSPVLIYHILPKIKDKLKELEAEEKFSIRELVVKSISFPWEVSKSFLQLLGIVKSETEEEKLFKKIRSAIKVSWQEDSNVIRIGFRWSNSDFAAYGAKLYAQAYMDLRNSLTRSPQSLEFYEEQIKDHEAKLREAEQALLEFQKNY